MFSNLYLYLFMQTIILRDGGTPPITTIAGSTVTTSSRLEQWFLGTQWRRLSPGIHGNRRANRRECRVPHSSVFSSCCFWAQLLLVIRLLRVSSGTLQVTIIAGSTLTTSSRLTTSTDSTFRGRPTYSTIGLLQGESGNFG